MRERPAWAYPNCPSCLGTGRSQGRGFDYWCDSCAGSALRELDRLKAVAADSSGKIAAVEQVIRQQEARADEYEKAADKVGALGPDDKRPDRSIVGLRSRAGMCRTIATELRAALASPPAAAPARLMYSQDKAVAGQAKGVLEQAIAEIVAHDAEHTSHGVGCACHDGHAGKIRRLLANVPEKSRDNFFVVLGYVVRNRTALPPPAKLLPPCRVHYPEGDEDGSEICVCHWDMGPSESPELMQPAGRVTQLDQLPNGTHERAAKVLAEQRAGAAGFAEPGRTGTAGVREPGQPGAEQGRCPWCTATQTCARCHAHQLEEAMRGQAEERAGAPCDHQVKWIYAASGNVYVCSRCGEEMPITPEEARKLPYGR